MDQLAFKKIIRTPQTSDLKSVKKQFISFLFKLRITQFSIYLILLYKFIILKNMFIILIFFYILIYLFIINICVTLWSLRVFFFWCAIQLQCKSSRTCWIMFYYILLESWSYTSANFTVMPGVLEEESLVEWSSNVW